VRGGTGGILMIDLDVEHVLDGVCGVVSWDGSDGGIAVLWVSLSMLNNHWVTEREHYVVGKVVGGDQPSYVLSGWEQSVYPRANTHFT